MSMGSDDVQTVEESASSCTHYLFFSPCLGIFPFPSSVQFLTTATHKPHLCSASVSGEACESFIIIIYFGYSIAHVYLLDYVRLGTASYLCSASVSGEAYYVRLDTKMRNRSKAVSRP